MQHVRIATYEIKDGTFQIPLYPTTFVLGIPLGTAAVAADPAGQPRGREHGVRVVEQSAAQQRDDLVYSLRDRAQGAEAQPLLHPVEGDAVVAGILVLLDELDLGGRNALAKELDEVELAVVLLVRSHVVDLADGSRGGGKDAAGDVLTGRVITWSSDAPSVATVSASGVVTAVAVGIGTVLRERIARMRAQGMTLQAIADRLNEEGVPTVRGGAKWRPSSVQVAAGYKRRPRPRLESLPGPQVYPYDLPVQERGEQGRGLAWCRVRHPARTAGPAAPSASRTA
jgi:hypothetical protein